MIKNIYQLLDLLKFLGLENKITISYWSINGNKVFMSYSEDDEYRRCEVDLPEHSIGVVYKISKLINGKLDSNTIRMIAKLRKFKKGDADVK